MGVSKENMIFHGGFFYLTKTELQTHIPIDKKWTGKEATDETENQHI